MKVVFIAPYPAGESPSQRFRFEQYFDILRENGIDLEFYPFWSRKSWNILYKKGHFLAKTSGLLAGTLRRWLLLFTVGKCDLVFLHRECAPIGPPIFEWVLAKVLNKKIIYDFDDAIWLPNTSEENAIATFVKWHSKTLSICKWSYRVSCGNAFLADYALQFNKNIHINPTTIDHINLHNPSLHKITKDSNVTTIGWTGSHSTIQYLQFLEPIINKLSEKYSIRFLVISNKMPQLKIKCLEFVEWNRETEIQDLMKFDIGVMPLKDDIWAKGKCGFKALQYMSLGIPTVASPVGVNTTIIDDQVNGFLCDANEEWIQVLSKLIEDAELRHEIGSAGIKKVVENYSVKSNADNFLNLFKADE